MDDGARCGRGRRCVAAGRELRVRRAVAGRRPRADAALCFAVAQQRVDSTHRVADGSSVTRRVARESSSVDSLVADDSADVGCRVPHGDEPAAAQQAVER
jgi:hypothetical protein